MKKNEKKCIKIQSFFLTKKKLKYYFRDLCKNHLINQDNTKQNKAKWQLLQ